MVTFLFLLALLNGNFSQGLQYWQADMGWKARHGTAVLNVDNHVGTETRGDNLCSDPVTLGSNATVKGSADVHVLKKYGRGYIFIGVKWYDNKGNSLGTEMLNSSEGHEKTNTHLIFQTLKPSDANKVSFCFFGGTYGGKSFKASVDNAILE